MLLNCAKGYKQLNCTPSDKLPQLQQYHHLVLNSALF